MAKNKLPILWAVLFLIAAVAAAKFSLPRFREGHAAAIVIVASDPTKPNDPITRALRKRQWGWGGRVDLVPEPFSKGQARTEIERILSEAKYSLDIDRKLSIRHAYDLPPDSQVYEIAASEGACNIRYGVAVRFDSADRLIEARGVRDEAGCL